MVLACVRRCIREPTCATFEGDVAGLTDRVTSVKLFVLLLLLLLLLVVVLKRVLLVALKAVLLLLLVVVVVVVWLGEGARENELV